MGGRADAHAGGLPKEQRRVARHCQRNERSIFAYFAAQIFEHLPEATQHFLVATAVLPQVPVSLARELTGNPQSSEILEDLYKRHLFTHRRPGPEPIYWYHALFRSFLKGKSGERPGTGFAARNGAQSGAVTGCTR